MCDNIKVAIKVRPLIRREKETGLTSQWRVKENTIAPIDPNSSSEPYCFDHIFEETISTQSLFDIVAKPIIQNCMKGINGTIFAYGQTSSGKTHTMTGTDTEMGVIPLSIHQIFHEIESMGPERQFLLRIAYIEIYNEKIFDLLDGKLSELKIRDTQNVGEAKVKCHEIIVNSPEKILHYLAEGNAVKRMEETKMNERSSRSHTIFRITIESRVISNETEGNDSVVQISNLNLVDLAGSEKASQTLTTGTRLLEGAYINRSLFSLGFVIKQLSEKGPETFINYRDSKLTRILQASLGGNSMTSIICTITPATVEETNYTLLFATRAKTIKNKPIINETVSEATVTRRLQKEISRLKQQLQVEQRKNSKYRIEELERDINERETKFVGSYTMRTTDKSRRRTWCPSSTHANELSVVYEEKETGGSGLLKLPTEHGGLPNINLERESPTPFDHSRDFDLTDDMFLMRPLEDNLSFGTRSEQSLSPTCITTPLAFKLRQRINNKCKENCQCDELEKELNDLKEFTRLEKRSDTKSSSDLIPQDYQKLKDKLFQKDIKIEILSSRNCELELQISRLDVKVTSLTKMENDLEQITKELNEAIKSKDSADLAKVGAEYEYDQLKKRTSCREKELTDMIAEFRNNENNDKFITRIQEFEDTKKEMEKLNTELHLKLTDEKLKYESLERINCQLITDLEQVKSKYQNYMSQTKCSLELFEENIKKSENDLAQQKIDLEKLTAENLVLSNELENNKNTLLTKATPCEKCLEFIKKLDTEQIRYGKLKQDFDSVVSSDLQEIQSVILTLQHYLKSLISEEMNGNGSGKENKNINDYIKDLKSICTSSSNVLTEKFNSNSTLNQSIDEFSSDDIGIKNSSFILSSRDETFIETLQNRTIDLENQIMKISNQLNKEFDSKAVQTEWKFEEFEEVNVKYAEIQISFKKLQEEYDAVSTGIMDWIQENEQLRKDLTEQEVKYENLNEKYNALLVEKQTLEEHKELSSLRINYEEALKFNQSLQENLNDYSTLKSKYDNLFEENRQLEKLLNEKKIENELMQSIEEKYDKLLLDKESLEKKFLELLKNVEMNTNSIEVQEADPSENTADEKSKKESMNELSLLQMKYNDLLQENQSVIEKYKELNKINTELLEERDSLKKLVIQMSEDFTAIEKHRNFLKIKYTAIIQEYRQLYSSVSNYETKLDNLEKETIKLKEMLVEFDIIQDKYEKLRAEKAATNNISISGDELETSELNAKKLVSEIVILSEKFESVLSERNLVEANYELLRSDYNATKEMLEVKIEALDSVRQKYEEVLVEKVELNKTLEELKVTFDRHLHEYETDKNNYDTQLNQKQIEYNQLETENQRLVHEIDNFTLVITGLRSQIETLQQAVTDLKTDCKAFVDETKHLKGELGDLNERHNVLTDNYNESEKLLNESKETEKTLKKDVDSLTGNMTVLQSKNEELEHVTETLKSSLEKASGFEKKYSAILIEKQIFEKQINDLKLEIDNYKQTIQEMEELNKVVKCTDEAHTKLLDKVNEIQESKANIEKQLRLELATLEEKYKNDLKITNLKVEEYKWNLHQAEATKSLELESVRELFTIKNNELQQSKTALEANLRNEICSIQNEYKKLQNSDEQLKSKLKTLEAEKIKMEQTLIELEKIKSNMEKKFDSQLDAVNTEFESLKMTLKDLRNGKSLAEQDLTVQLTSLNRKYDEMETHLKSELKAAQHKCEMFKNKSENLSTIQAKYDKLHAAFEELQMTKAMMEKNMYSIQTNSERYQITIKTLEQNKISVEQNLAQIQLEYNALKEQNNLLLNQANVLEKSIAKLEIDNKTLKQSKQELEMLLKNQASEIYAINTRLTDSEAKQYKLKLDHETFEKKSKYLQIELDTLKCQSKSLDDHSIELKEKTKRVEILENKKKELLAQLHELQNMHLFKTNQFEAELKTLNIKLEETNMKLMQMQKNSIISKNKLLNENSDLKKKNESLFFEIDDIKRKQIERKSRRSITYDNNRSTLLDAQTVGTMTDRTTSNCNCDIMNEKIKELTRENYIKDCHITNYKIKEKNNPLIMECSDLREKLTLSENNVIELERQLTQLNVKLRKVRDKTTSNVSSQTPAQPPNKSIGTITDTVKSSPVKPKHSDSKTKHVHRVQTMERLIQTEFTVDHESKDELHTTIRQLEAEINRLRMRYEESKCLAIARRRKIDILNDQIAKFQRT